MWFVALEVVVNIAVVLDVAVDFIIDPQVRPRALRYTLYCLTARVKYWKTHPWQFAGTSILTCLSIVTLCLVHTGCSGSNFEQTTEMILLIVRNTYQLSRLIILFAK